MSEELLGPSHLIRRSRALLRAPLPVRLPENQAGAVLGFVPDPCTPSLSPCLLWELPSPVFGLLTGGWRWVLLLFPLLELLLAPPVRVCLAEGAAGAAPAPLPSPGPRGCVHLPSGMEGQSWHKDFVTLCQKLPWDFPGRPNPLGRDPLLGVLITGHWYKTRGLGDTKGAI